MEVFTMISGKLGGFTNFYYEMWGFYYEIWGFDYEMWGFYVFLL
jgi:hypothetical protein